MAIAERLRRIARAVGGLMALAPLDVTLFEHSVTQPDVMYFTPARRSIAGPRVEGAPDLVVEVLSPGTARRDRGEKLRLYAEAGVREYWIVDASEQQIEFLRNQAGEFVVALPENGVYRSQAIPEIFLEIPELWHEVEEDLRNLNSAED